MGTSGVMSRSSYRVMHVMYLRSPPHGQTDKRTTVRTLPSQTSFAAVSMVWEVGIFVGYPDFNDTFSTELLLNPFN